MDGSLRDDAAVPSRNEVRLGLAFYAFGLTAPLVVILCRIFFFPTFRYNNPVLHAVIEGSGATIALITGGLLYVLHRQFHWTDKFRWASCSLISMGTIALVHILITSDENSLVAAELLNNLCAGSLAMLCWLPARENSRLPRQPWVELGSFLGSAAIAIWAIDNPQSFPTWLETTGYSQNYFVLSALSAIFFLAAATKFFLDYRATQKTKNLFIGDLFLLSGVSAVFPATFVPWGPLWWSWQVLQFLGYLCAFALVTVLAIRLEKQLETSEMELKRLTDELARSNEDLVRFAHVASHDLQQPLRMIAMHLAIIDEAEIAKLSEDARQSVDFARDGAKRLQAMVTQLLRFSEYGSGKLQLEPVDLNGLVETLVASLDPLIAETHAEITVSPLPRLVCQPSLLSEALQNLIVNAIKYHGPTPPRIRVEAHENDRELVVVVKDEGTGIDPKFQKCIFDPLRRLHGPEIPGTGMGLTSTKRIIERLGGRIWLESSPGLGSSFFFSIPRRA